MSALRLLGAAPLLLPSITGGKEKKSGVPLRLCWTQRAARTHLGEDVLVFDDVLVRGEQDVEFPAAELRYKCPSCCRRALQGELPREMLRKDPRSGKESHVVLEKKGRASTSWKRKASTTWKKESHRVLEKKKETKGSWKKKGEPLGPGEKRSHGVLGKNGRATGS